MAKKKPGKKAPKKAPRTQPSEGSFPELPDPMAMEAVMREFLGSMAGNPAPDSPRGQAEELIFQALDTSDPTKRVALAQKALKLSPDCTDAYVVLAEQAESRKEALELYRQGVEVAERFLGPEFFKANAGDFWGLIETRPYMRARAGLADILWASGHRDEAIAQLQGMLQLNPHDNQGVRYVLAGWLLNMDRFDDLAQLLGAFDEETAAWAYTKALLAFRRDGDVPASRTLLKAAGKANAHVPDYLLGKKPIPRQPPAFYGIGDANEAILYAGSAMGGWKSTPGALAWLRTAGPKPKASQDKGKEKAKAQAKVKGKDKGKAKSKDKAPPKPKGPLPLAKKRLLGLPQEFDVWQADARQLRCRIEIEGELVHPWVVIVASRTNDLILSQTLVEETPSADLLWDQLTLAMETPLMGEPHRPTELHVHDEEVWGTLETHLGEIEIEVETVDTLDQLDFIMSELELSLTGDQPPRLLDMPGVTPELVAGFYQAAAEFYRRAPWRKLGYESAIRVESDHLESGPRFAVVMGQSGLTFGLAIYDDLKLLKKLWTGRMSDEENARETVALTVTYDDDSGISDGDLNSIEEYDWEVVNPEAYPSIFRKERGLSMRPPLGWEIELMQGCLKAIPDFIDQHPLDDLAKYESVVKVASGELRLSLSWVDA